MTMRSMFGDVQDAPASLTQEARRPAVPTSAAKEIPYDHVATFLLLGQRGNRVQDVINVSTEGAFVAVAVGYSFIAAPLTLPEPPTSTSGNTGVTPQSEALANWLLQIFEDQPTLPGTLAQCLLARVCGIEFKYSLVDSGTGRELQNRPIHNLAGLGESTGQRPFRPLAKPMLFMPRSTIRIEVEEISEGLIYTGAQLYIVLHGYKVLGYGTQP
jgi:hypothetical protein